MPKGRPGAYAGATKGGKKAAPAKPTKQMKKMMRKAHPRGY